MWIIASLPFWLLGLLFAVIGGFGAFNYMRREFRAPGTADTEILWGGLVLLAAGGVILLIAAKVAS